MQMNRRFYLISCDKVRDGFPEEDGFWVGFNIVYRVYYTYTSSASIYTL